MMPSANGGAAADHILEAMGDAVFVLGTDGRLTHVNEALVALTGHDRETLLGGEPATLFDAESAGILEQATASIAATERDASERVEATIETADGHTRPVEVVLTQLAGADGSEAGTVAVVRGLADDEGRDRHLERYETIIRTLPDPVAVLDLEGRHTFINNIGRTGYTREELLGARFSTVTTERDAEKAEAIVTDLFRADDREKAIFEQDLVTKTGERIPHETHVALLPPDEDGMSHGLVAILRDISDRKARERELQAQNERLESVASIVSHDLRNPLNVAQGRLELAARECESEHLAAVERAHDRMEQIIADVLTLAREGGEIEELAPVELSAVAEAAWAQVETASATLAIETDGDVMADGDRLQRLLENLFRNAVEHGGAGVAVTVGELPDGFFVGDDGPGIPAADRSEIFTPGYSTTDEGTGFGLSIVTEIAAGHGWTVDVSEASAGGACIEVREVERVA